MSAEILFNYLILVAALWAVSEGALLSFWKPFVIHPIRDYLLVDDKGAYKKGYYEEGYRFICLLFLFISGALTMAPAVYAFDAFGVFTGGAPYELPFGLGFSHWYGAMVTNLLMVAGGELIHDYLASKNLMPDPMDVLPVGVVVEDN